MDKSEAAMLIGLGAQGTAALAVIQKLFLALVAKEVLREPEVIAILNSAAESVEMRADELGNLYSQSTSAAIREMRATFFDVPENARRN